METFSEELVLRPFPDGRVLAHFHFEQQSFKKNHHHLFPRAVDRLTHALDFEEIEIHLTRGRWRNKRWGEPTTAPKPPGAELIARYPDYISAEKLPHEWGNLTHALSGLLCSSLNLLEQSEMVVLPETILNLRRGSDEQVPWLYGTLPQEPVCTENLTPWLKLLPCRDSQGIASLLADRQKLYTTEYHSLGMAVHAVRSQDGLVSQKLTQTLLLVIKPKLEDSSLLLSPIDWSLSSIFGQRLEQGCAVASTTGVYLEVPKGLIKHAKLDDVDNDADGNKYWKFTGVSSLGISPQPSLVVGSLEGQRGLLLHFEVSPQKGLDLGMKWFGERTSDRHGWDQVQSKILTQSYLSRVRGDSGGLVLQLDLIQGISAGERVCFLQQVPWFIRVWIHSMKIAVDGKVVDAEEVVLRQHFHISEDRKSPFGLEMCLQMPLNARSLAISFSFTKGFLTVMEHPPDAYRGFDIPGALVIFLNATVEGFSRNYVETEQNGESNTPLLSVLHSTRLQQVYAPGTLVHLVPPDFSMPYNVCCLTCTALAIYVGMVLKVLTRREEYERRKMANKSKSWKKQAMKVVALLVSTGALVMVVDPDVRDSVYGFLIELGVLPRDFQAMEL